MWLCQLYILWNFPGKDKFAKKFKRKGAGVYGRYFGKQLEVEKNNEKTDIAVSKSRQL